MSQTNKHQFNKNSNLLLFSLDLVQEDAEQLPQPQPEAMDPPAQQQPMQQTAGAGIALSVFP